MGAACRSFPSDLAPHAPEIAGAQAAGYGSSSEPSPHATNGGAPGLGGTTSGREPDAGGISNAGGSSDSGAAGEAAQFALAGAAGANDAGGGGASSAADDRGANEPVLQPSCRLYDLVGANAAVGIATALTFAGTGVSLFTWDRPTSTALVRWSADLTPRNWTGWVCFDLVPDVSHLAALNLSNGAEEVFAASRTGRLFMRTEFDTWGAWLPLSLPARDMTVLDLEAVGGALPRIYVLTGDNAYVRSKVSEEPYSAYGLWRSLAPPAARSLAAIRTSDDTQRVFVASNTGTIAFAEQPVEGEFGDWQSLPGLANDIVDLAATSLGTETVLHALGANGALYSLSGLSASSWQVISAAALGIKAKSLASRASGNDLQLFAIDAAGSTYRFDSGQWVRTI